MKLDRKLIKAQAKQLVKNNIWKLLLITIVVSLLSGTAGLFTTSVGDILSFSDIFDSYEDRTEDKIEKYLERFGIYDDDDYYDEDNNAMEPNDPNHFKDFTGSVKPLPVSRSGNFTSKLSRYTGNISLVSIIMCPLSVALWGVYLSLVRGKCMEVGESFSYTFSKTFDKNYFKKLFLIIIIYVCAFLLSLLFLIPGIIYLYKVRFAMPIMAEYPDLSPSDAIKLSKKMTADHKGELFVLDLSFIPWALLVLMTFGVAYIYFSPYRNTVEALYYVNFKIRCEQEGRILPQEYLSAEELAQQAPQNNAPQQQGSTYYQPYYQQPQQSANGYYQPQPPVESTPVQSEPDYYQSTPTPQEYSSYQPEPPQETVESDYYNSAYSQPSEESDNSFGSNMDNNYWNSNF